MRADLPVETDRAMESEDYPVGAISLPGMLRSVSPAYAHIPGCAMHPAAQDNLWRDV